MSVQYSGDKITFADGSIVGSGWSGFKNRIINGAMMIDQRNAGASVTINPSAATLWPVDRFIYNSSAPAYDSKATSQQVSTAPTGFSKSLLVTVTGAVTPASTDFFSIEHRIEGFNVADLGFGTSAASTVTVSFWVRSSLTGAFGGALTNSARNRSYPFSYAISAANTWEQKTVTIAGDTTGTWPTDNTRSMILILSLGAGSTYSGTAGAWFGSAITQPTGSTNLFGTSGATFYITGVQLEKGSTATSFDYRPYGTELALCQRYYYRMVATGSGRTSFLTGGVSGSTTAVYCAASFPVPMRTAPSSTYSGVNISDANINAPITSITVNLSSTTNASLNITCSGGGLTAGRPASVVTSSSTSDFIDFSSEL